MGQALLFVRVPCRGLGRSPNTSNATNFAIANTDGSFNNNNASNSNGVCLGLCIKKRRCSGAANVRQSSRKVKSEHLQRESLYPDLTI